MKKTNLLISLMITIFLFSCGENSKNQEVSSTDAQTEITQAEPEIESTEPLVIIVKDLIT